MKQLSKFLIDNKIAGHPGIVDGAYSIQHTKIKGYRIQIIASTGMDWEHVSITLRDALKKGAFVPRCPTWAEMCYVKDLFWDDDEAVVQFHPPKSEHVNNHPYCLHLWRPISFEIPMPDSLMVGVK